MTNDQELRISVKMALLKMDKTELWLFDEVKKRTGKYIDHSYLSKILRGKRRAPEIVESIKEILNL